MISDFQNIFEELTTVQWAVLITFLVVFVFRFVYLFLFTARLGFYRSNKSEVNSEQKLSIIVTLRNEEEQIRENLPKILKLENVDFEVVVIDDFSQDNSLSVLGLFNQRYGRLKISTLSQETRHSVKLAQNIALKSASNNWVLVVPVSMSEVNEKWLQSFVESMSSEHTNAVISYSTIVPENRMFNRLYRIENFYQHVKCTGYICNNIPFVYSEENLAFTKDKYFQLGGFGKKITEPYANLELVINQFISKRSTALNMSSESIIKTEVDMGSLEYFDLIKKSFRIESYLPFWKKQFLFIDTISQVLFIPLIIAVILFCFGLWSLITTLIGLKLIAQMLIIKIMLNRLNEHKIFIPSLVYGLIMPYYKLFLKWHFNRTSRKHKWRSMV